MNTELHKYQRDDCRRIHEVFNGVFLNANDMGLGKTLETYYYAWRYLPADSPGPIVIVVPQFLKLHWEREARKHLGLRVEVLYGQRCPADKQPPLNPNQVYIINYEILVPPHWSRNSRVPKDSWIKFLIDQKPRLIVADEGHRLSNHRAAQTRAFRRIARVTPHRGILTGSPIINKPTGLWSLLNILLPEQYPVFFDFADQYTHARMAFGHWQFEGAKNLDLLNQRLLRQCMIRRRKEDVLDQLPPITYSVVPVEIDYDEYNAAERDYIGWLEKQDPLKAQSAVRAEELSRLGGLKQLAGILKAEAVIQWIKLFLESGNKFMLGAIHHNVTDQIMSSFSKYEAVRVDGRCNAQEKDNAFHRFNTDPDCRLFIGNIQAAGVGWSCRSTSDACLCEMPWLPGEVDQFAARIHGLERGVAGVAAHMRFLVAPNTIDEDICKLIDTKKRWSDIAIDGRPLEDNGVEVYKLARAAIQQRAGWEK